MNPPYSEKSGPPQQSQPSDAPAPSYTPFRTTFACMSLHRSDRIRMMQFPPEDISAIRDIIKRSWSKGLQAQGPYSASYEFKLYGNPWHGQGSDAIPARIIMREILSYLFSQGWILHVNTDVSKSEFDTDSLIFRKQQSSPPSSEWVAISFNQNDRLRLIGAPQGLLADVRVLLKEMKLLQAENWKDRNLDAWEYKLHGRPWFATGEDTIKTRVLLLRLLETLERKGWSVYASIDQSTRGAGLETDSWYIIRDKAWVEGAAVFHR